VNSKNILSAGDKTKVVRSAAKMVLLAQPANGLTGKRANRLNGLNRPTGKRANSAKRDFTPYF